jgi:hypothetical protein
MGVGGRAHRSGGVCTWGWCAACACGVRQCECGVRGVGRVRVRGPCGHGHRASGARHRASGAVVGV